MVISNSIAVDPTELAVYIVSNEKLYRVDYDPVAKKLTKGWGTVYGSDNSGTGTGRLGEGKSGSDVVSPRCAYARKRLLNLGVSHAQALELHLRYGRLRMGRSMLVLVSGLQNERGGGPKSRVFW